MNYFNIDDIGSERWQNFSREIRDLGKKIQQDCIPHELKHIQKMERWSRTASLLGYAAAFIAPNPISAFLLALGNYTRWSVLFHPISHGAYNHLQDFPAKYKSQNFARGWRRYIDWLDWIYPRNWHIEHDVLHHSHLGTEEDPDMVRRNTEVIRHKKIPLFIRNIFSILLASTWKWSYYAPNTLLEYRYFKGLTKNRSISLSTWSPFNETGRELWSKCILPYFLVKFIAIPSLFLIIGKQAALFVLINTIFAEIIANIYSFLTIATNHTGDDIYTFENQHINKADFYVRQIIGSVNYPNGSDFKDFLYGGMNYQIEHHIWPNASLLQLQKLRPELQKICNEYEIPYKEEPLRKRAVKLLQGITYSDADEIVIETREGVQC